MWRSLAATSIKRAVTVRESTDDARAAADLADDALEWVIRSDLSPVVAGEGKVGQRFLAMVGDQVSRARELHGLSLATTSPFLVSADCASSCAWIALSMRATSATLLFGACENTLR